ncbi:MAG: hypothetical protein QM756_25715 [Polyangiaceae bacterium]
MLLRRSVATALALFVLSAPAAGGANVLEDIVGYPVKLLLGSTIDKAQSDVDASVAKALDAVDVKLKDHEGHISNLATELLDRGDHILDARILQVKTSLDDSVERAMSELRGSGDELIDRVADKASGLIEQVQKDVLQDLDRVDELVKNRSADINKMLEDRTNQINVAAQERIAQVDEVARARLGDVNAIATRQRLELERMLERVAVAIGAIVFLVFVLRNLWNRYTDVVEEGLTERGAWRAAAIVRRLAPALVGPVLAAGSGLVLLGALYRWLPASAEQELATEVGQHRARLAESVLLVDPPRARFEASVLSYLDGQSTARYDGLAAKATLIRDVIAMPALLASESAVEQFAERVGSAERSLGPSPDADLLTLRAMLLWKTGGTRRAEHEAASLAARALNLAPRGFGLLPLARAYVETFLNQPYIAPELGEGRDAMALDELADALALAAPEPPDSPFAGLTELSRLMRTLEAASSQGYVQMVEANAVAVWAVKRGDKPTATAKLAERTQAAQRVVEAWHAFDRDLQAAKNVKGRLLLSVFGMNDALFTRALWFASHPNDAPARSQALLDVPVSERVKLAPARIAWARRYAELLGGTAGKVLELEEARQFKSWERWARELEDALVAAEPAKRSGQRDDAARWRVVVAAAALGLYVEGNGAREPYAWKVAEGLSAVPQPVTPLPAPKKTDKRKAPSKDEPPQVVGAPKTLAGLLEPRGQRLI